MARARNIKPGFFTNEVLCELPPLTRLLFIGLWTEADKAGRLEDRPLRFKMRLFPADAFDIEAALSELHDGGFIERYSVDGARYIQVSAWAKHQRPHYQEPESSIPAPNGSKTAIPQSTPHHLGFCEEKSGELTQRDPHHLGFCPPKSGELTHDPPHHGGFMPVENALIPDTGYLIPDTGLLIADAVLPQPQKATTPAAPVDDWSTPDPQQLIREHCNEWAQLWLEPGNVPRAAAAAEREWAKSQTPIMEWVSKISASLEAWGAHHAEKRSRDRRHFVPYLERWFSDGDFSRRPPGAPVQRQLHIAPQAGECVECGGIGEVFPAPPEGLKGEAALDWQLANKRRCGCGVAA